MRVSQSEGNGHRIAAYLLDKSSGPQAYVPEDEDEEDAGRRRPVTDNSMWVGSEQALGAFGLERGGAVKFNDLVAALEHRHVQTGAPVGSKRNVPTRARVELHMAPPKSVSALWSQAGLKQRAQIERAVMLAANRTLEYMTGTKPVVRRRIRGGGRVSEVAKGMAASLSLHVTSRQAKDEAVPAPQLHVHAVLLGVLSSDGKLVPPDSWPLFRKDAPLEGGAVFRAVLADELVRLGYRIESDTGVKGRFFELAAVPKELCEVWSGRTREVVRRRDEVEAGQGAPMQGGSVAVLALETRQTKTQAAPAPDTVRVWRAQGEEHGFSRKEAAEAQGYRGYLTSFDSRRLDAHETIELRMREQGPTVSPGYARALAYSAAPGRMSFEDMHQLVEDMERGGDLLALRAKRGSRVTTRDIRELEERVMRVALEAAAREVKPLSQDSRDLGVSVANASLKGSATLADDQETAFEILTSGKGWVSMTGRAGTGKNATLIGVAAAYRAEGWRLIACGADGSTSEQLGRDIGIDSYTIEQLRWQQPGELSVDDRTVFMVDEATKVSSEHWGVIADLVERHQARVIAVGHTGQLQAIELPGMFAEFLRHHRQIPVAALRKIFRHRHPDDPDLKHPWLGEYQVLVDRGYGAEAVDVLRREGAIHLYDTRAEAMEGMVGEWNVWRHGFKLEESVLIVHGTNADVDAVNILAQEYRFKAEEIGGVSVKAVDREYQIYEGDLVIVRGGAYRFRRRDRGPRLRRVENGAVGVVDHVDPDRDVIWVHIRESGHESRVVEFDLGRLRGEHEQEAQRLAKGGKPRRWRPPTIRLHYGSHVYPKMGANVDGSAVWAGHGTQRKEATYVGDTRSRFRHSVHLGRSDFGDVVDDEVIFKLLAKQISESRNRSASIAYPLNPEARINVHLPSSRPFPELPLQDPTAERPAPTLGRPESPPPVERSTVRLEEPALPGREQLGARRAAGIEERSWEIAEALEDWDRERLREVRDAAARAFGELDPDAASEALALERAQAEVGDRSREALEQAGELESRAAGLQGVRRRREREDLLDTARALRDQIERDHAELASLGAAERELRKDGRHPDQWVEEHGGRAALWIAIERRLAIARELEVLDEVERAVEAPPVRIRDLIGALPDANAPERSEWEALARELEHERLISEAARADGSEPPVRAAAAQRTLDRRIQQLRVDRDLGPTELGGPGLDG